jgi:uncharacterized protein YqjF (DUF2071 family)
MKPREILQADAHRPWPLPAGPWIMRQTWNDLLFAHWALAPEELAGKVPAPLELDLFENRAWLAVTPFWMSGIRARALPPLPGLSAFPELNVRTYVHVGGKPGVFFFSLDAASRITVHAARWSFALPYFYAEMESREREGAIHYRSRRVQGSADLRARFRPIAEPRLHARGSLEHFLTERYCLYTVRGGKTYRAEIHHLPWPLQVAEAEFETNTMAQAAGFVLQGPPLSLLFAKRLDVLVWGLQRAGE